MTVTSCGVWEYSRLSRAAIKDPRGLSSPREHVGSLGALCPPWRKDHDLIFLEYALILASATTFWLGVYSSLALRDVGLGTSHVSFSAVPFVVWLQAPHPDRRAAT